jgi:hypothetical protein
MPNEDLPPLGGIEAYYDKNLAVYWMLDHHGDYLQVDRTDLERELKIAGFKACSDERGGPSEVDKAVSEIQLRRSVDYAGPLAGYMKGLCDICGQRVLVTSSPTIIQPHGGPYSTIKDILGGMLGGGGYNQVDYFNAWLKIGYETLAAGQRRPGQAMAIAGPRDACKSFTQNLIITPVLGGRVAKPYEYMTKRTTFNDDMFKAEHLSIEDEAATTDIRSRLNLGAQIKIITVNDIQRHHRKYCDALSLAIFWRLSITVNDDPEHLMILPPLDDSIEDKVMLLLAQKFTMPMPTQSLEQRKALQARIAEELPAYIEYLCNWEIPEELRDGRFGVRHFHHPELLAALDSLSPEMRLLSLINEHVFSDKTLCADETFFPPWTGTASRLEAFLVDKCAYEARRLFSYNTACGVYLGRLHKKLPGRISRKVLAGQTVWTIQPHVEGLLGQKNMEAAPFEPWAVRRLKYPSVVQRDLQRDLRAKKKKVKAASTDQEPPPTHSETIE